MLESGRRQFGIFHLREFPDPILNRKTKPVKDFDKIALPCMAMKRFLGEEAIGIAANQVGVQLRFFLWQIDEKEAQIAINPRIVDFSTTSHVSQEGCLSFPGNVFHILRSDWVDVLYYDLEGNELNKKFSGLHSDLMQHEIDHLDGITPIKNINLLKVG